MLTIVNIQELTNEILVFTILNFEEPSGIPLFFSDFFLLIKDRELKYEQGGGLQGDEEADSPTQQRAPWGSIPEP